MRAKWFFIALFLLASGTGVAAWTLDRAARPAAPHPDIDDNELEQLRAERRDLERNLPIWSGSPGQLVPAVARVSEYDGGVAR